MAQGGGQLLGRQGAQLYGFPTSPAAEKDLDEAYLTPGAWDLRYPPHLHDGLRGGPAPGGC